jgi:large subunit ribosomal protein L24
MSGLKMKSIKPGKQRKLLYNAPLHKKRKWLASHLAENLLLKYDKRSIPVITGDTVKVMRGSFKGHEDKVASIHVKKQVVEVEGITTVKADGTKVAKSIYASNLLITKLNLTDRWRRQKLERGLSETTRKEIEEEAKDQIKELEEEKIAEEKLEEEQEMAEESIEEEVTEEKAEPVEKTPAKETEKTVKPVEKKADKPKEKEQPKQKKAEIKPKTDKKPAKKKTSSKTPSKPKEKKEEVVKK